MYKVYLLGISGLRLTAEQKLIVERCPHVVAASRYKKLLAGLNKTVLPMVPIEEMLAVIGRQVEKSNVAVLASGDPLFFGVGRKILSALGPEMVEVYSAVSSMQLAFSRFKEPWEDAVFISLHGRRIDNYALTLLGHRKVFVLTDRQNSPAQVSKVLLSHLQECGQGSVADSYEIFVGENLGMPDELLVRGSLEDISGKQFGDLNVMILKRGLQERMAGFPLGLQEREIAHSRGLITKDEVRAATLHKLRLPACGVFWDIGAGSGSISVEAAILCPRLNVFAVERNAEELENIKENIRHYQLSNLRVVEGQAPEVLASLPSPDRVFVGGSGGKLPEIITFVDHELNKGGRIVVNGVLEQTREMAPALLYDCGFKVTISEISVSRRNYPASVNGLQTFNTIDVIEGKK